MLIEADKYMYHDMPKTDADKWIAKIKPQAFNSVNTAISYSPLADSNYEGSFGYIFCGNDRVLPLEAQKYYANISGIKNTVLVEAASHAFFVGTCEETVAATVSVLEAIGNAS